MINVWTNRSTTDLYKGLYRKLRHKYKFKYGKRSQEIADRKAKRSNPNYYEDASK